MGMPASLAMVDSLANQWEKPGSNSALEETAATILLTPLKGCRDLYMKMVSDTFFKMRSVTEPKNLFDLHDGEVR